MVRLLIPTICTNDSLCTPADPTISSYPGRSNDSLLIPTICTTAEGSISCANANPAAPGENRKRLLNIVPFASQQDCPTALPTDSLCHVPMISPQTLHISAEPKHTLPLFPLQAGVSTMQETVPMQESRLPEVSMEKHTQVRAANEDHALETQTVDRSTVNIGGSLCIGSSTTSIDSGANENIPPRISSSVPQKASDLPGRSLLGVVPTMQTKLVEEPGIAYKVFYTKQKKKHKSFQSGILAIRGRSTVLFTDAGKQVAAYATKKSWMSVGEGESLGWVRDMLIEVETEVAFAEYLSGRVFLGSHILAPMETNEPLRKRPRSLFTPAVSTHPPRLLTPAVSIHPPRLLTSAVSTYPQSVCPEISNVIMLDAPDVYIDAFLACKLQRHQVEGVKFLYQAFRRGSGAILADGMGLGKTLQALTFLWVLLSKTLHGRGLAKKAVVVCPSSLCGTWKREVGKWIGARMIPTMVNSVSPEQTIHNFCLGMTTVNDRILIISYDFLRRYSKVLTNIDVLICDEGHRMSHDSGATHALRKIGKVRMVLTGTPLQNNLDELFALCDFVCPNIVADWNIFKKTILKSRDPAATEEDKRLGTARAEQLDDVIKAFLLRRTTDMLNLPPKNVFLVFLPFTDSREYTSVLAEGSANPLGTLQKLRRICFQSKISVVRQFLETMWEEMPQEKIVLVSSFTTCLDLLQQTISMPLLRLDGSTAAKDRQSMVDNWNSSAGPLVFLLSSRAGGVGLNLQQGGQRMVIIDPDWNPANDLQVMGRLWRMGQNKEVFIYRLCMAGSIEEKILQRQEMKVDLAALALDGKSTISADNWTELRQLFRLEGIVDHRTATFSAFVLERIGKLHIAQNAILAPWGPYIGSDAESVSAESTRASAVHSNETNCI